MTNNNLSLQDICNRLFGQSLEGLLSELIGLFLPFIATTWLFAIEYSDIREYVEDHGSNINKITLFVFFSFFMLFKFVPFLLTPLSNKIKIEEKSEFKSGMDAIIWLAWQLILALIAIYAYSSIFIGLFSAHFNLPVSAERTVFENDFFGWIVSIYLANFLFCNTELIKKLILRFRTYNREVKA